MASWETVCRLAEELLPEVEHSTSYHTPALKVRGKLFARLREDDASIVVFVEPEERAALIAADPDAFFVTPHYENHPTMLIMLSAATEDQLADRLVESWRRRAPKRVLKAFDDTAPS